MSSKDPAFPSVSADPPVLGHDLPLDRWKGGLTKREYAAVHIFQGLLAAGPKEVPPLKEVWKLADQFLEKGDAQSDS